MIDLGVKIKQSLPDTATLEEVTKIADKISKAVSDEAEIEWSLDTSSLNPKESKKSDGQKPIIFKGPLGEILKILAEMMKKRLKK